MKIDGKRNPSYNRFSIKKGNGKRRQICAPDGYTKEVQWYLLKHLENIYTPHKCAYGFVAGRSIFENAGFHVGQECVLNIDLKDFFPSIKTTKVIGRLSILLKDKNGKYRFWLLDAINKWCFLNGSLPQGAPTSPILSNIIMEPLDDFISDYAEKNGLVYTRYADDLTFSGKTDIIYNKIKEIKRIIKEHGLTVNNEKVRVYKGGRRKAVTGIVVDQKINVPRDKANRIRAILHNIEVKVKDDTIKDAETLKAQSGLTYDQLHGYINFMMQANPDKYGKYQSQLDDMKFVLTR